MKKRTLSVIALLTLLFPLLFTSCFGTDSKEDDDIKYDVAITFPNGPNGHGSSTINGDPVAFQSIKEGTKVSLTFTKDDTYRIDSVIVKKNGASVNLGSLVNVEIQAIDADYSYEVFISKVPVNSYIVSGSVVGNGDLTPKGDQVVTEGGSVTFNYGAQNGYKFDSLIVDGVKISGHESSYLFTNVQSKHTLVVYYSEVITEAMVDILFDSMMVQLERISKAESLDDVTAEDFSKMATDFKSFLGTDSSHMKAGVGYIVSSVANLNSNEKLKEVADSLDSYFSALNDYWGDDEIRKTKRSTLFSKAYQKGGIEGLGTALLANSSKLMRTNGTMPSFPKMITMSKIQNLIESEIVPVLDGVIDVIDDVESVSDNSLVLTFDGETFEIDLGEIYLTDASLRLLRHTLLFVTAYNYDIKSPDGQDVYAVINKFITLGEEAEFVDKYIYNLSADGDTLYVDNVWYNSNDSEYYSYMYDLIDYNMKSSTFLSLTRANHAKMYSDIKMVPEKIKKAIAFITAEGDDQDDDILKIADIDNLTADMVDIAEEMKLEGISATFADNFTSPTALADYITKALTGPVTFKETINGVSFDYTIDFSKFYTNPVQSFKDWFPLYKMSGKENAMYMDTSSSGYPESGNTFYLYNEGDSVAISPDLIESVNGVVYTLKKPFVAKVYRYIDDEFMPFHLVDNNGNTTASTYDEIEDALFDETLFPHFKDYTFNGIFPGMNRTSWYELFQNLDSL